MPRTNLQRSVAFFPPLLLLAGCGGGVADTGAPGAGDGSQGPGVDHDAPSRPHGLSEFEGKIGRTYEDSVQDWPEPPSAPEGAPNVVVILLDDVGFGQPSTFGGLIPTPNLGRLAANGLCYDRFHTTAICGPSRAALLTGRNHHDTGNGFLMEWATSFPNYSTMMPRSTATIGEILRGNGYTTWWYGKNHNTPDWETSVAGPFDRWPTGMGFEYFCGFIAGETHQHYPVIFESTTPVEPEATPEEGYHFMTDMTEKAIARMRFSKSVAPNKPLRRMSICHGRSMASNRSRSPANRSWRDSPIRSSGDGRNSTSRSSPAARSTPTAGRRMRSTRCLGGRTSPRATGTRTTGSSTTWRRTSRKSETWPSRCRRSSRR